MVSELQVPPNGLQSLVPSLTVAIGPPPTAPPVQVVSLKLPFDSVQVKSFYFDTETGHDATDRLCFAARPKSSTASGDQAANESNPGSVVQSEQGRDEDSTETGQTKQTITRIRPPREIIKLEDRLFFCTTASPGIARRQRHH